MGLFLYIFRFLHRIRWWLIIGPLLVTLIVIWKTRKMSHTYTTEMTIFTGVVSGYGIESEQLQSDNWSILNNTLQNIINIMTSKETLKNVSLHLYARCMIYGNPNEDNTYISAEHYQQLKSITPKDVLKLIDKSSEEKTVHNLIKYDKPDKNNFVYGLFNWYHPFLSYSALKNIDVKRVDNSDILTVKYSNDDPGIVFQTLTLLNQVYVEEYKGLQFGTTNNVIKYFESELARIGRDLHSKEDSLTEYNVENRVINYDRQTEEVTALDRDYELRYQDVLLANNSSKAAMKNLDEGLSENQKAIKSNSEFLSRLNAISDLNYSIAQIETLNHDSINLNPPKALTQMKRQLEREERDLKAFSTKYSDQKYTRDGYPTSNFVSQWIDELLKFKKSEAELQVLGNYKKELDFMYSHFSPIGSTIKRQERGINFTEQSYLSILSSLNTARLRLKSLEMSSASLKVINPPTFPLSSLPTKRRAMVAGAFIGSLLFILGFSLLIELLDRTLRDRYRTQRITGCEVLGAFPQLNGFKNGKYNATSQEKAIQYIANKLHGFFTPTRLPNVVNLLSKDKYSNSQISELLAKYWTNLGIGVQLMQSNKDFDPSSKEFLFSKGLEDIYGHNENKNEITLFNHTPISDSPIPSIFLKDATINLLVLRADVVWTDSDQLLLDDLRKRAENTPLLICLVHADRSVVESFTGLLPPYTSVRKFNYRYNQFGFTSSKEE